MFILLTGGNGSGKSAFAERIAAGFHGPRVYAATMIPFGAEGEARKQKHVRQREGLGFLTAECPFDLAEVPCGADCFVLLEDVSNLLANLTFEKKCAAPAQSALSQIAALKGRCGTLAAVTVGGVDASGFDGETRGYAEALNWLNERLAELADTVIGMRGGGPCLLKGEFPCLHG